MKKLKGAIFSLRDVLIKEGAVDHALLHEVINLLKFLRGRGVGLAIVSNSEWIESNSKKPIAKLLGELAGFDIPYFQRGREIRAKQTAEAMAYVHEKMGWGSNETVYIGSTTEDMQAARNGGLLFLNAQWHAQNSAYGFAFESPLDIARFIDCCCLDLGDWFWSIDDGPLQVRCIAPLAEYSKRYPNASGYSSDAKAAVKLNKGDLRFWGRLMAARIYFSGIGTEVDYVSPYPGHAPDSKKTLLTNAIKIVAGSLRAQYLEDMVVRHALAQKSQSLRNLGKAPDHLNQLSTIKLRPDPLRTGPAQLRYKTPPLRAGKKVLLVDDICTEGFSLEAARSLIESTGASVICVTWLKTPGGNDYQAITSVIPTIKNPYAAVKPQAVKVKVYGNNASIKNANAPDEVADAFLRYSNWKWPT